MIHKAHSLSLSLSLPPFRENKDINLTFLILKVKFYHRVEKYHQMTRLISPSAFVSSFLELLNLNKAKNCLNFSIERFNINNIILLVQFKYNFRFPTEFTNLYISKSWSIAFIVAMLQLSHIIAMSQSFYFPFLFGFPLHIFSLINLILSLNSSSSHQTNS